MEADHALGMEESGCGYRRSSAGDGGGPAITLDGVRSQAGDGGGRAIALDGVQSRAGDGGGRTIALDEGGSCAGDGGERAIALDGGGYRRSRKRGKAWTKLSHGKKLQM